MYYQQSPLQDPHHGAVNQLRMTLAASLLVLVQAASAADEISITPSQRQVNVSGSGIVTLRFEVENRSGITRELQEQINLPEGWQLISNTAPFLLSSNGRDVRLVHVSLPKAANAGNYRVDYQVSSRNDGAIASSESINIRLESTSGTELSQHQAPGSLLEGEQFIVDYIVKNTGNQTVNYRFAAYDSDSFITAVEPRQAKVTAGSTRIIRVKGRVNRKVTETSTYKVTLQARGGGKRAEHHINVPLIARVSQGVGRYQKLPGKLRTSFTFERNQQPNQNGEAIDENSRAYQLEYFASGRIDEAGKHNVEIRLRNGKQQNAGGSLTDQLEEYYVAYWNDELKVKTGHQSFNTTRLIGNSLNGLGASAQYRPQTKSGKTPLQIRGFYGRNRPGESETEHSVFAALSYDWGEYEVGASLLKSRKDDGLPSNHEQTIGSVSGAWRGKNFNVRAEVATDDGGSKAYWVEAGGQWKNLGFSASVSRADLNFSGSISDAMHTYGSLHYKINERSNLSFYTRHKQENINEDLTREIRSDDEQHIRFTHTLGNNDQASISVGYRQRQERDKRPNPTTNHTTKAVTLEYQHRFEDFDIRVAAEKGRREDKINASSDGSRQELSINWRPTHAIKLGTSYAISQGLDSPGKATAIGINSHFRINGHSSFHGYAQYNQNDFDDSHSRNYELQYKYDLKKFGEVGVRASRVDNMSATGERDQDYALRFEYSLPLDVPFRKRRNIGAVKGTLRHSDNTPAKNIVLKMEDQYAITDESGTFFYPSAVARDYQINIDNTRPDAAGLMLNGTGKHNSVTVSANKTTALNLTLQRGARLQGKIAQYTPDTGAALFGSEISNKHLKADKGIGLVLLELKPIGQQDNRITYRRTTLFDGSFSFMGVPPGKWELVINDPSRVPDNYRLEKSRFMVDLVAGDNQQLLIKALPVAQTIKKSGPAQGFTVSG
ncbi:MAG: hypothetical protein ACPGSM_18690 [Thiolinea sp.]